MTMRPFLIRASIRAALGGIVPLLLLAPAPAQAHFKLSTPADELQTDVNGDPPGGSQKVNPCGVGTPSGMINRVVAGGTLHVKLTETVPHGGHYRIALVPKYNPTTTDIPEPKVTPDSGACDSAEIESPVKAPVIADNLFPHTQAEAVAGKVWETDVQMPQQTGQATLQIIEFMTPHTPGCFYHHCAQLEIVSSDAGIGDGGVVVIGPDGGDDADDGGTGGGSGDGGTGGGSGDGGAAGDDAGNGGAPGGGGDSGGCSVAADATPSLLTMMIGLVATGSLLRRRGRRP